MFTNRQCDRVDLEHIKQQTWLNYDGRVIKCFVKEIPLLKFMLLWVKV
jgi:hypothetical protein